jgi:cadmium resistance protein CadD (predicted permease)
MKLSFLLNNQQVKFFLPKFISVFFRAVPLTILGFSVIEGSLLTSKTLAQTATTTEVSFRYSGYITLFVLL